MRKLWLALLGVALVLAGGTFPLLFPRPGRVTEAAFERIEPGMTQAEVEAILGDPPGDYETGRRGLVLNLYGNGVLMEGGRLEQWGGDEGFIQVGFGEEDTVLWTQFVPAGRRWNLIEEWLGRPLWGR
jgi:hypothetical protein